jgi:hypothetical protein
MSGPSCVPAGASSVCHVRPPCQPPAGHTPSAERFIVARASSQPVIAKRLLYQPPPPPGAPIHTVSVGAFVKPAKAGSAHAEKFLPAYSAARAVMLARMASG